MPHHYDDGYSERILKGAESALEGMFKTLPSMPSQPSPYTSQTRAEDQPLKATIPAAIIPAPDIPMEGV